MGEIRLIRSIVKFLVVIFILIFFLGPIVYLILTSLKEPNIAFTIPPKWIFKPNLINYKSVFGFTSEEFSGLFAGFGGGFIRCYLNSLIISFSSVMLSLMIGSLCSYALVRFPLKGKKHLSFWILSTRMGPPIAVVIPFFIAAKLFGLYDTKTILIILYMTINLPYTVWMMKGFFEQVPEDLEESAMVDGCSRVGAFLRITLPLVKPGLIATSIFCLIFSWNEFLFAFILTGSAAKTLPVKITEFITIHGIVWGPMTAAATLITIPILLFSVVIQRHLVKGLTFGAVK
jgi:multiple sugar transport system permease protein